MFRTALLSVYDKAGIVEFAQELVQLGWTIYSSGGTAAALTAGGIPVTDVSELVGGGAILGHRVVTLSREIHAGLLARPVAEDLAELDALGIPFFDLVCVDLYPLAEEIARPGATPESVIDKTDIGGPTMLRSAAKGRRIVVASPAQRPEVLDWLRAGEPEPDAFRRELGARAEAIVADYCLQSARYHSGGAFGGMVGARHLQAKYGENAWQAPAALFSASPALFSASPALFSASPAGGPASPALFSASPAGGPASPALFSASPAGGPASPALFSASPERGPAPPVSGSATRASRPDSPASPASPSGSASPSPGGGDPLSLDRFEVVAGTAPSYNNLAEIDRQLQTITHIAAGFARNFGAVPAIAIGTKHGNPCGAAAGDDRVGVIRRMVMGDPRAIFGGLVMINFALDEELAEELLSFGVPSGRRLLDGISAPSFSDEAIAMLSRKGDKCRFLANSALGSLGIDSLDAAPRWRYVRGGFLAQPNYTCVVDLADPALQVIGELTVTQANDMVLAWAIGATSNSNTITLVKEGQLIGNGVGQQDRVGCCELAVKRARDAGHTTEGSVAYSDSFFPFADAPLVLADAGVTAIWATTGSVRDKDTQALCAERGIVLCQVPDPAGRGFFGH